MDALDAIKGRASVRAFLNKPVAAVTIKSILDIASWAPSGTNTQPWQVAVVVGQHKQEICQQFVAAHRAGNKPNPDYHYYPREWFEPYKSRRFACGMALYGALNIKREDTARRSAVWEENYRFFDAPVGLFFLIDKRLETGSWMDLGMFIQNVMLSARGHGLETCPQASMAEYPDIVRNVLGYDSNQAVACGMALGYADYQKPINQYRTEREPVDGFTKWYE